LDGQRHGVRAEQAAPLGRAALVGINAAATRRSNGSGGVSSTRPTTDRVSRIGQLALAQTVTGAANSSAVSMSSRAEAVIRVVWARSSGASRRRAWPRASRSPRRRPAREVPRSRAPADPRPGRAGPSAAAPAAEAPASGPSARTAAEVVDHVAPGGGEHSPEVFGELG
jgi:hypothetical protein